MSFNTITDPTTGIKYSIFSNSGRELLKNYLRTYKLGGDDYYEHIIDDIKNKIELLKKEFNDDKIIANKEKMIDTGSITRETPFANYMNYFQGSNKHKGIYDIIRQETLNEEDKNKLLRITQSFKALEKGDPALAIHFQEKVKYPEENMDKYKVLGILKCLNVNENKERDRKYCDYKAILVQKPEWEPEKVTLKEAMEHRNCKSDPECYPECGDDDTATPLCPEPPCRDDELCGRWKRRARIRNKNTEKVKLEDLPFTHPIEWEKAPNGILKCQNIDTGETVAFKKGNDETGDENPDYNAQTNDSFVPPELVYKEGWSGTRAFAEDLKGKETLDILDDDTLLKVMGVSANLLPRPERRELTGDLPQLVNGDRGERINMKDIYQFINKFVIPNKFNFGEEEKKNWEQKMED